MTLYGKMTCLDMRKTLTGIRGWKQKKIVKETHRLEGTHQTNSVKKKERECEKTTAHKEEEIFSKIYKNKVILTK